MTGAIAARMPPASILAVIHARSLGGLLALGVLALAGGALVSGVGGGESQGHAATGVGAVTAESVTDPSELLFLQSCASCHGDHGQGAQLGPSLAGSGPAAWDFYLRTGRMPLSAPGNPSYLQGVHLSPQQIDQLIAYGATIGGSTPAIPDVVVDTASLTNGRDLFINNCAACHGAAATGGSIGAGLIAPSIAGHDPTTLAEAVMIGPGAMPRFDWTQAQLSDVAAYVQYLGKAASPGGIPLDYGPVPEGLIAAVIGLSALVFISRWVAKSGRQRNGNAVVDLNPDAKNDALEAHGAGGGEAE